MLEKTIVAQICICTSLHLHEQDCILHEHTTIILFTQYSQYTPAPHSSSPLCNKLPNNPSISTTQGGQYNSTKYHLVRRGNFQRRKD
jgi:hypothetical protein